MVIGRTHGWLAAAILMLVLGGSAAQAKPGITVGNFAGGETIRYSQATWVAFIAQFWPSHSRTSTRWTAGLSLFFNTI
jgi:hypothetical protein